MRSGRRKGIVKSLVIVAANALVCASSASAATLSIEDSRLVYRAAEPAEMLNVERRDDVIRVSDSENVSIAASAPCVITGSFADTAECPVPGLVGIVIRLGDGNDQVTVNVDLPTDIATGGGDDAVTSGDAYQRPGRLESADVIDTGAGSDGVAAGGADDRIIGGPDRDFLDGDGGSDVIDGGDGNDELAGDPPGETAPGEPPYPSGNDQVLAGPGDDLVDGGGGADTLDGGPGEDFLRGHEGDDVLRTRDGFPELSVDFGLISSLSTCGPGDDTAELDFVDRASECERLSRSDSRPRGGSTLVLARKKVRLGRSSVGPALSLPARCKGPRGGNCTGWIEFHSSKLRVTQTFDRRPYFAFPVPTLAAGRTKTRRFDLYPHHASVANRIRGRVLRTKVLVMTRDAAGRTRTTTQRVDFLPPR